jgi:Domain of unknown function (DUF4920)
MKKIFLLAVCLFAATAFAQHTPLPRGTVYGTQPEGAGIVFADNLAKSMGQRITIVTSIKGKVLKVTKQKGGWFTIDGGKGTIIYAHFKDYRVTIPADLAGHTILADGVATKQFVSDDSQHLAGTKGKESRDNPKQSLKFEVSGLMVQ